MQAQADLQAKPVKPVKPAQPVKPVQAVQAVLLPASPAQPVKLVQAVQAVLLPASPALPGFQVLLDRPSTYSTDSLKKALYFSESSEPAFQAGYRLRKCLFGLYGVIIQIRKRKTLSGRLKSCLISCRQTSSWNRFDQHPTMVVYAQLSALFRETKSSLYLRVAIITDLVT